jgi:peptidoglycan/xylan/chitin deacetylase (PgdA/CDA1 family)
MSVRLGGGVRHLRKYRTMGTESADESWQARFASLCEKLNVSRTVQLLRSSLVETPVAVGVFKPLVLIPAGVFLQIPPHELETIIAHELIHIRRYDPLVNSIQTVIEVALFYHPGVWWISRRIRLEREFAADEAVMHLTGASNLVYARALATLEEIRLLSHKQTPRMAIAANGGSLMERIQRILKMKTEIRQANFAWSAVLAVALISALLAVVFSAGSPAFVNAEAKSNGRKLAIGFVSIPPVDRTANPPKDSDATARLIIAKLTQHHVPAIGFITGSTISDGTKLYPVRAEIVRLWRDAGLEVGIGNFKHVWFNRTSYDDYVTGVEKNEAIAKKILAEKNLPLRYFSYPYLNTGKSVAERDQFENWLANRGLRSVKYTFDNNEWMYSYAYDMARNDNDIGTMTEIRVAFVKYMNRMFDHYESYSQEMFGRDIPQTMVLTPSRLVADSADDLFGVIEKRGYTFVSMDEALADEAFKTKEDFIGDAGISWFERWRMKQGKPLLDEPKVDESIQQIWASRKPQ